jgi:SnoaL-like domain
VVDYAEIVDTQDYARLREIFAEDAVFARPTSPREPIRGVANIVASFESRPCNRLTQHLVTNIRVRVQSPTTASGSCRIHCMSPMRRRPKHQKEGKRWPSKSSASTRTATCARKAAGDLRSAAAGLCSILSRS